MSRSAKVGKSVVADKILRSARRLRSIVTDRFANDDKLLDAALKSRIGSLNVKDREQILELVTAPRRLEVKGSELSFHVRSATEDARVRKFKEPWTVDWLRAIPQGGVLYDVGANIGVTALIAAEGESRSVQVVAIEPFPSNFASLVENLLLNRLNERVIALPLGLSATTRIMPLHWAARQVGASMHSFGDIVHPKMSAPLAPVASHYCLGYRFDDLVQLPGLPFPTHIKIDVDGGELDVLAGADEVLRDSRCRTVQIEVSDAIGSNSSPRKVAVVEIMKSAGFLAVSEFPHRLASVCDIQFEKTRP